MVNEEEKEKPVLSFNCQHFSLYDSRDNEGNYWDIFKHQLVVKYGWKLAIIFLYYPAMLSISIFSFLKCSFKKAFLAFFLHGHFLGLTFDLITHLYKLQFKFKSNNSVRLILIPSLLCYK